MYSTYCLILLCQNYLKSLISSTGTARLWKYLKKIIHYRLHISRQCNCPAFDPLNNLGWRRLTTLLLGSFVLECLYRGFLTHYLHVSFLTPQNFHCSLFPKKETHVDSASLWSSLASFPVLQVSHHLGLEEFSPLYFFCRNVTPTQNWY